MSTPIKFWEAPLEEMPTSKWLRQLGHMLNAAERDENGLVWMTDALAKRIATSAIRRSEVPDAG